MVVYNRDSSGNWVASESGQSAASLGYGSSGKSSSTTKSTTTQSTSTTPSSSTSSEKSYTYTSPTTGKTSTTTDYRHSDAAKAADAANRAAASSGGSTTQKSPPSSGNSISTSSPSPGSLTVQPTYISGGKGGNTYIITYSDGTQNQIAASGQSLADSAKYYQEKADQATAKGNTSQAAKYQKSANEFAAAANYEKESGVTNTYGTTTGKTYDATASIYLNESGTGVKVADTALEYKAGYGATDSTQTKTLTAKEVSTKLGEALSSAPKPEITTTLTGSGNNPSSPLAAGNAAALVNALETGNLSNVGWLSSTPTLANTTTLTGSGNNTSLSEPPRYQWDDSKGVFENLIEGTAYNFNKTFAEPFQAGGIGGVISNAPVAIGAAWTEAGQTVDNYILWSDQALASDDPLQKTLGVVNTILSPVDAIRVGKMITDGRAGEITGENGAWALLDVATLVPVAGWAAKAAALGKLGKLSKLTKAADGLTDAAKAGDAAEDAAKIGKKSDNIPTALQPADAANLEKDIAKLEKDIAKLEKTTKATNAVGTAGTLGQVGLLGVTAVSEIIANLLEDDDPNQGDNGDDGNKDATIDLNEKPQKIWDDNPYHWEYNPDEQRPYSEQDISDILSAALAGLSGSQTSGGAGGGGDITIVNETPAASSSSSDWFEQVKPYIVPALIAIVIIALIALSGKDGKKTKSKGARV